MKIEEIQEIEKILNLVPPGPWHFSNGDIFDHWELWSSHELKGYHMVQDDSGVPPDQAFIEYVLKSREIIETLLNEVRKNQNECDCQDCLDKRERLNNNYDK